MARGSRGGRVEGHPLGVKQFQAERDGGSALVRRKPPSPQPLEYACLMDGQDRAEPKIEAGGYRILRESDLPLGERGAGA